MYVIQKKPAFILVQPRCIAYVGVGRIVYGLEIDSQTTLVGVQNQRSKLVDMIVIGLILDAYAGEIDGWYVAFTGKLAVAYGHSAIQKAQQPSSVSQFERPGIGESECLSPEIGAIRGCLKVTNVKRQHLVAARYPQRLPLNGKTLRDV